MANPSESKPQVAIRFNCPRCKAKLKVPPAMAGRYMPCPKCKQRIPAPINQAEADAEDAEIGVQSMAYDIPANCMKCGVKMRKGSVICINCGFDYREGKQIVPEDNTIRQDDKMRGKPALRFAIGEAVILAVCIGCAIVCNLNGPIFTELSVPDWVEYGVYLAGALVMVLLIPAHIVQWNNYRQVPDRETPRKLIEDRAERDEARSPYGSKTAPLVVLCLILGFGIAFPVWGGAMYEQAKKFVGLSK